MDSAVCRQEQFSLHTTFFPPLQTFWWLSLPCLIFFLSSSTYHPCLHCLPGGWHARAPLYLLPGAHLTHYTPHSIDIVAHLYNMPDTHFTILHLHFPPLPSLSLTGFPSFGGWGTGWRIVERWLGTGGGFGRQGEEERGRHFLPLCICHLTSPSSPFFPTHSCTFYA